MFYVAKQDQQIAESRSILIAAVSLIYMILFGHSLPNSINNMLLTSK
jgi:hypothetical protein